VFFELNLIFFMGIIIEKTIDLLWRNFMNSHSNRGWGPLEYILLIVLIFLLLSPLSRFFWPAIQLFYNANLK